MRESCTVQYIETIDHKTENTEYSTRGLRKLPDGDKGQKRVVYCQSFKLKLSGEASHGEMRTENVVCQDSPTPHISQSLNRRTVVFLTHIGTRTGQNVC